MAPLVLDKLLLKVTAGRFLSLRDFFLFEKLHGMDDFFASEIESGYKPVLLSISHKFVQIFSCSYF